MKPLKPEIVLILSSILLLLPFAVKAQEGSPAPEAIESQEIVITYTRQEIPKQDVAANIVVITREEMEKTPATNAAEVLQYVPGVYVEINGGPGSQATATIQGSDMRHVAVYQDGVPLNMLANPMTDLSFLPIIAIDRIEVYKGAASSAWGSSLGGVINIITREPDLGKPFGGELRSTYGDFNTFREYGLVNGGVDRLGYLLSVTHEQSDGFIPFKEYRQDAVYAKMNYYVGSASRLNFVYSFDDADTQDPSLRHPDYWNDMFFRRQYQRLLYETPLTDDIGLTFEGRHQQIDGFTDHVYPDHKEKSFDYVEETWGFSARMGYVAGERNRFNLGFDGDWGSYDFSKFADASDSGNWALYGNDTFSLGRFAFTGGLRYDNNLDFGSEVSPSAGVVCHLPEAAALLRAQVARGFSAPPGAWVHDPDYGNNDLKAETGINYQVGGEVTPFKPLKIQLDFFRADVENLILFKYDTMKHENIDKATRQGVEGTVRATFDFGLALSFGASFTDARDDTTDEVLEDIPRIIYQASASHTYKWLFNSITGRYLYNNSGYPETRDRVFVFDYLIKARLPFPECAGDLTVFATVHDITDSGYLLSEAFPQPGRWVEGGMRLEF
jgi:vitamin B12 transporter